MSIPSLGMLVLPLIYTFTPWLRFADYHLPAVWIWLGIVIYLAGQWLIFRSHVDLGQNWSATLEIRQGHSLVTQGVYRTIRHPMYAGHWLWGVAQSLLLQNWLVGFSMLVCLLPMYLIRTPREEQMMLDEFGAEYREYMKHTGRIIPRRLSSK